jgi:hypothetical protein
MKYLQKHREETADQPDRLKTFSNQTAHRVSQSAAQYPRIREALLLYLWIERCPLRNSRSRLKQLFGRKSCSDVARSNIASSCIETGWTERSAVRRTCELRSGRGNFTSGFVVALKGPSHCPIRCDHGKAG